VVWQGSVGDRRPYADQVAKGRSILAVSKELQAEYGPTLFGRIKHPTPVSFVTLSVLDLVTMRPGEAAGAAIGRSVETARHVENLGYKRFWLAEHHSIPGVACSATSLLIAQVANATKRIRVGSGGVMLPNHAPLVVAEQFGTLESLFPGRIDLGLGRAPGSDMATIRALRGDSGQNGDDFPELLQELRTYLGRRFPGSGSLHTQARIRTYRLRCSGHLISRRNWLDIWGYRSHLHRISRPSISCRRCIFIAKPSRRAQYLPNHTRWREFR
jgi:hypothetical protein